MPEASKCPITHSYAVLSSITAFVCCVLFLSTAFLNSLIIYIVVKDRRSKFKLFFYKLLLNISIADVLTGFISDTIYTAIHIKEAVYYGITESELLFAHLITFMFGGVSLITLTFLCMDRIAALICPYAYRKGISKRNAQLVITSSWILSCLLASIYFFIGFMRYLVVFSVVNVVLPFCLLALTVLVYYQKLIRSRKDADSDNANNDSANTDTEEANLNKNTQESNKKGRRATLSLLKMLIVFILNYLPACVITIYFNACVVCNCFLITILRDVAVLLVLSGSLFRAINFIITLKSLKKEAIVIFGMNNSDSQAADSSESGQK